MPTGTAAGTGVRLQIKRAVLPNGVVVIANENPTHPSVALRAAAVGGPVEEPPQLAGLADFTGRAFIRGTERLTFEEISQTLDEHGILLSTGASRHSCDVGARCLKEDLPLAIELMADVLRGPTFPAEEVEKLRGQILTGIKQEENDTAAVADRLFREAAYPEGHPYRRRTSGYEPTVAGITRSDLERYHSEHVRPSRTIVAVAGDVVFNDLIEQLTQVLGDWNGGVRAGPLAVPSVPPAAGGRTETVVPGKTQSDVVLGAPALGRSDPDYYDLQVGTLILGQLGMHGRLGANVREEQGLAYYCYSYLEGAVAMGPWVVRAGVNPDNVERALDSILLEMRRFCQQPVDDDELDGGKRYLQGRFTLQLETNDGIAGLVQSIEFFRLGLDYPQRYAEVIGAVTKEGILSAAQRYLPVAAPIVVIAGPPRAGRER